MKAILLVFSLLVSLVTAFIIYILFFEYKALAVRTANAQYIDNIEAQINIELIDKGLPQISDWIPAEKSWLDSDISFLQTCDRALKILQDITPSGVIATLVGSRDRFKSIDHIGDNYVGVVLVDTRDYDSMLDLRKSYFEIDYSFLFQSRQYNVTITWQNCEGVSVGFPKVETF